MRLKKPVVECRKKKILAAYNVSVTLTLFYAKVPKCLYFSNQKRQTSNENFLIGQRSTVTSLMHAIATRYWTAFVLICYCRDLVKIRQQFFRRRKENNVCVIKSFGVRLWPNKDQFDYVFSVKSTAGHVWWILKVKLLSRGKQLMWNLNCLFDERVLMVMRFQAKFSHQNQSQRFIPHFIALLVVKTNMSTKIESKSSQKFQ